MDFKLSNFKMFLVVLLNALIILIDAAMVAGATRSAKISDMAIFILLALILSTMAYFGSKKIKSIFTQFKYGCIVRIEREGITDYRLSPDAIFFRNILNITSLPRLYSRFDDINIHTPNANYKIDISVIKKRDVLLKNLESAFNGHQADHLLKKS